VTATEPQRTGGCRERMGQERVTEGEMEGVMATYDGGTEGERRQAALQTREGALLLSQQGTPGIREGWKRFRWRSCR